MKPNLGQAESGSPLRDIVFAALAEEEVPQASFKNERKGEAETRMSLMPRLIKQVKIVTNVHGCCREALIR